MSSEEIVPAKITKPIQLLASLLVGLLSVNGSFLTAAGLLKSPDWIPPTLVVASLVNVPLFLGALFLLLTAYRPQMQDDQYYSRYLMGTPKEVIVGKETTQESIESVIRKVIPDMKPQQEEILRLLSDVEIDRLTEQYGGNRTISELFRNKENWNNLVDRFEQDVSFRFDLQRLIQAGLINLKKNNARTAELTELGLKIAEKASTKGMLFHTRYEK